ncbi:hypothetical protein chiPu_0021711 [Chiloscyllium punctatum]|uniref:G-protein coupled receptors family 1 profile domain-containing protein n=1 Tax=Chiloscyllium punctatum TaxID=137246 RepID=A0A401RKS0_CHIPU|nr:hypothetical protein [Chiloscyllium punctatum]
MLYNTRYSSKRRVTLMITMVWALSFAISCPLLFGLKNHPGKACGRVGLWACGTLVREATAGQEGAERAHHREEPGKPRPAGTPSASQCAIASGSGLTAGKWEAPSSVEVSRAPEWDGPGSFFRGDTLVVRRVMDEEQAPAVRAASRSKVSHQKEKKATQMLAIVLGESRTI